MPTPTERKTAQARILKYAQGIGWTFMPRYEAEQQLGFDEDTTPKDRDESRSMFFDH